MSPPLETKVQHVELLFLVVRLQVIVVRVRWIEAERQTRIGRISECENRGIGKNVIKTPLR